jgi:hypothetical protein
VFPDADCINHVRTEYAVFVVLCRSRRNLSAIVSRRQVKGRHAVFRLDKAIPSDATVLCGAISEITAALVRTGGWGGADSVVEIIKLVLRETL